MDFDEALRICRGIVGQTVEVSTGVTDFEGEFHSLTNFWGVVRKVQPSHAKTRANDLFYVYCDFPTSDTTARGPSQPFFILDRAMYQFGDVKGLMDFTPEQLEEAEPFGERGDEWEIMLRHHGLTTAITVYV